MSLHSVDITADVHMVCLGHALSSETEEIMGLLLGDVHVDENSRSVARIWGLSLHVRSDRRSDRVEIHPEQLAAAAAEAERISQALGVRTRVIGWYHSHPHLTVLPSHVDVRTQGQYQMLDNGFIGLIFSVFNVEPNMGAKLQVTAFQSDCVDENGVPVPISPDGSFDSKRFYQQKPVELSFISSSSSNYRTALQPLVDLQRILHREERNAFTTSIEKRELLSYHPLQVLHSTAIFTKVLCRLTEFSSVPLLKSVQQKIHSNERKLKRLQEQEELLLRMIENED